MAISKREKTILKTLKNYSSVADIVKEAELPRTSVIRTLSKLESRGLIVLRKNSKRTLYKQTTDEVISEKLLSSISAFGISVPSTTSTDYTLIHGAENIAKAIITALNALPQSGQFNGIQTSKAAVQSIEKVGVEKVAEINDIIKKKKLIVRGVVNKDGALQLYQRYGEAWLTNFRGRTAHFVTVPDKYLTSEEDLYIMGKQILFINWKKETALCVTDTPFCGLINSLYLYLFESGERIDYHLAITN